MHSLEFDMHFTLCVILTYHIPFVKSKLFSVFSEMFLVFVQRWENDKLYSIISNYLFKIWIWMLSSRDYSKNNMIHITPHLLMVSKWLFFIIHSLSLLPINFPFATYAASFVQTYAAARSVWKLWNF